VLAREIDELNCAAELTGTRPVTLVCYLSQRLIWEQVVMPHQMFHISRGYRMIELEHVRVQHIQDYEGGGGHGETFNPGRL
jgi:hypothetical protein